MAFVPREALSADRPPRILMVAARYHPYVGGLETHVDAVSKLLAQRGFTMTVATTDVSGQLPPYEVRDGVHVIRVRAYPARRDYFYAPALQEVIARPGQWDLIHCQGVHTLVPFISMRAAHRASIPYVLTFHAGGDMTALRRITRRLQWRVLRPYLARAERLVAVSQDESEYFQQVSQLPATRFAVVRNGASHLSDISLDPATARSRFQGSPRIVSVGRLERYKGHQRVIAAMPHILKRYPEAHLQIVGTGSYEEQLRRLVRTLRLDDHVTISFVPPGDIQTMAQMFASADVTTLLSEHEGEGIVVLEALSFGRPVVVAYAAALREFADQGLALAVSLRSSSEEVAAAIIRQIEQPVVPASFVPPSWERCADQLQAVYTSVLSSAERAHAHLPGA